MPIGGGGHPTKKADRDPQHEPTGIAQHGGAPTAASYGQVGGGIAARPDPEGADRISRMGADLRPSVEAVMAPVAHGNHHGGGLPASRLFLRAPGAPGIPRAARAGPRVGGGCGGVGGAAA
ncbi:hypothetical protein COCNU_scaffold008046G000010 [Cocos nucifera]|nr:hypothetical protein [Cocos nucifera]